MSASRIFHPNKIMDFVIEGFWWATFDAGVDRGGEAYNHIRARQEARREPARPAPQKPADKTEIQPD